MAWSGFGTVGLGEYMELLGACSGDLYDYVAIRAPRSAGVLRAHLELSSGKPIPTIVCSTGGSGREDLLVSSIDRDALAGWVVAVPHFDVDGVAVITADSQIRVPLVERDLRRETHRYERRDPTLILAMRHAEDRMASGRTTIEVTQVVPASGADVWRVRVDYRSLDAADSLEGTPVLRVLGSDGSQKPGVPIVLDDALGADDDGIPVRHVTFSIRVRPEEAEGVVIAADLDRGESPARTDPTALGRAIAPSAAAGVMALGHAAAKLRSSFAVSTVDAENDNGYELWFDRHRFTWADAERQRSLCVAHPQEVLPVSVVLPVGSGQSDEAAKAAATISAQSYPVRELLVVGAAYDCAAATSSGGRRARHLMVTGDAATLVKAALSALDESSTHVLLVSPKDRLEPSALWCLARVAQKTGCDIAYCDGDAMSNGHLSAPQMRPFANLGKLRSMDYLGSPVLISRSLPSRVGWLSDASCERWPFSTLLYDLELRAFESHASFAQTPHVLSHRCGDESGIHEGCRAALQAHLARCGVSASVEDGPRPRSFLIRYELPDPAPRVSIILPNRDHANSLEACVRSLLANTDYKNFEIAIIDCGSAEPATHELCRRLSADSRVRVIGRSPEGGETQGGQPALNYSASINYGVARTTGELLLFLDNDVRAVDAAWLGEMVGQLNRPEVAIVGAKLLGEDGLVRHAGVVADGSGRNMLLNRNIMGTAPGYLLSAALPSDFNMVTGVCQLVRREVFQKLGGYDERLAVGYNDSDFCLRAREAGYSVTLAPRACLVHRGLSSCDEGECNADARARLFGEQGYIRGRHASFFARGDDAFSLELDRWSEHCRLPW